MYLPSVNNNRGKWKTVVIVILVILLLMALMSVDSGAIVIGWKDATISFFSGEMGRWQTTFEQNKVRPLPDPTRAKSP